MAERTETVGRLRERERGQRENRAENTSLAVAEVQGEAEGENINRPSARDRVREDGSSPAAKDRVREDRNSPAVRDRVREDGSKAGRSQL